MTYRYCLTLDLIDDLQLIAEYRRYHEAVWPEVTDCLRETGIVDMELYLLGTRLVMVLEVGEKFSFEKKASIERGNAKVQEWEKLMWKFQRAVAQANPGEKWALMERVFKL
jgi:L-rhamnose mutarotase